MSVKHCLVIAIEDYHDPLLPRIAYAQADGMAIGESFKALGCYEENAHILHNHLATRTTILDKVEQIARIAMPKDSIYFYYKGHGFYQHEDNMLSCVDTSVKSIVTTSVAISEIMSFLLKSAAAEISFFLDCNHSDLFEIPPFSHKELIQKLNREDNFAGFISAKENERSIAHPSLKHGVWTHFLLRALNGQEPNIYFDGLLYADRLDNYLNTYTKEFVKFNTLDKKDQSPCAFGLLLSDFMLADLAQILEQNTNYNGGLELSEASIETKEDGFIKNLPGFNRETDEVPKSFSSHLNSWVQDLSQQMIEDEIQRITTELKNKLDYKRRDLRISVANGIGEIVSKDFDYFIEVHQSETDAASYIVKRSIQNFSNSKIMENESFNEIFNAQFDIVKFSAEGKIQVESIIDKIEALEQKEQKIKVDYDHLDTSKCEIQMDGFDGKITLTEKSISFESYVKNSPAAMIALCASAQKFLMGRSINKLIE